MRFVLHEQVVRSWYWELKFQRLVRTFHIKEFHCFVFKNRSIILSDTAESLQATADNLL